MNYWPSEVTNLSDLNEPLFRLIKEVSESGKETARIMYGANGWVLHHNTDIWRITGALDKAPSGMWPSGGAWFAVIYGNDICTPETQSSCVPFIRY